MNTFRFLLMPLLSATVFSAAAQDRPVGYWRSHMPYNNAVSVATDGAALFTATDFAFYTYNTATQELSTYSKTEGMSDVDMSRVAYDAATGSAILGYKNCNIDIYKDNSFYNVPDLKIKTIAGQKSINNIYCEGGFAYISTSIGVVVLNISRREIKETYEFTLDNEGLNIYDFTSAAGNFYIATSQGLFRASKNNPAIRAFSQWTAIDSPMLLKSVVAAQNKIFTGDDKTVYAVDHDTFKTVYTTNNRITHIDAIGDGIWISVTNGYNGVVLKMDLNYQLIDSFNTSGIPMQTVTLADNSTWYADSSIGLKHRSSGSNFDFENPNGPGGAPAVDIYAYNKNVLVAHGGHKENWLPLYITQGYSELTDDKWSNYNTNNYSPLNGVKDIINITKDKNDGTVYACSFLSGLFIRYADGHTEILNNGSPIGQSGPNPGWWQASGVAVDNNSNVWLTMFGSPNELYVRTTDKVWHRLTVNASRPYPNAAAKLIIDQNNLVWYVAPAGGGLIVYDCNGTPENAADDKYRQVITGAGHGNLPSSEVYCVVEDRSGSIWAGTGNGIAIFNCPTEVIAGTCDAEQRIVQYDQFPGYLFQNEIVQSLAVDGADRKWVGTTNGIWLLSPDASKIISRFNIDNSPLPSNNIQKISIDPVTGDVYVGTDKGLISYRGTATEGGETNKEVLTFPNPVPSGYTGTVAIKGLTENADVRITDVSGQLIYRTTALGGQAVWNGYDYKGRRPQSGVYLIFIANKDGSEKNVGKMVFMN